MAERQTTTAVKLKSDIAGLSLSLSLSRGYKGLIVSSITWKMLKERCEFNLLYPQPGVGIQRDRQRPYPLTVFASRWFCQEFLKQLGSLVRLQTFKYTSKPPPSICLQNPNIWPLPAHSVAQRQFAMRFYNEGSSS